MKRLVVVATILGSLAFAGQAMAANSYKVYLGQQGPSPAGVPKSAFLDQFLPSKVTVNAGDSVTRFVSCPSPCLRPRSRSCPVDAWC